jgi:hypothetical protein
MIASNGTRRHELHGRVTMKKEKHNQCASPFFVANALQSLLFCKFLCNKQEIIQIKLFILNNLT